MNELESTKRERLERAIMFREQVQDEMQVGAVIEKEYAFKLAAVSQRLLSLRQEWLGYRQEVAQLEHEIDAAKDNPKEEKKAKKPEDAGLLTCPDCGGFYNCGFHSEKILGGKVPCKCGKPHICPQ